MTGGFLLINKYFIAGPLIYLTPAAISVKLLPLNESQAQFFRRNGNDFPLSGNGFTTGRAPYQTAAGILFVVFRLAVSLFVFVFCGMPAAFDSEALKSQTGKSIARR